MAHGFGLLSINRSFATARVRAGAVSVTVLLALSAGCGEVGGPDRPNVILVTLDAVRADHLSCYGYHRNTSPFLDEFARRGCLFGNCRAASSWTVPAVASVFTSLYPATHGVRNGIVEENEVLNQEVLEDSFVTLAEALRAEGYATFGVSSNLHISRESGMGQGFDRFVSLGLVDAAMVHAAVQGLKHELRQSEPFFLWVHYYDPHAPYQARFPAIEDYGADMALAREWEDREIHTRADYLRDNPEILATLVDLYDSEIHHTDSFLRKLFEEVIPGENNLAVIVADHGEAFLEHGFVAHGMSLFEEELRVPLVITAPGGRAKGMRVPSPVSALDIYPTVLDYAGVEAPAGLCGVSLRRHLEGPAPGELRPVISELGIDDWVPMRSIALGRWKYIEMRIDHRIERQLFDLSADPEEERNLVTEQGDVARRLYVELERRLGPWSCAETARQEISLSSEDRQKLESLGYVGCGAER